MVSLTRKATGMVYSIINVYMPNNYMEKIECWQSLQDLATENPPQNLIIVGDFNTTRGLKEKRGGTIMRDQFRERMDDLISDLDLFDVPSVKGMYTWNNRRAGPGHIAARLDRFLISSSFLALPDKAFSSNLPWAGSDHRPIMLTFESQKNWGPIPFRFNPLWMERSEFLHSISQIWNQWITGSPNYIWEQKLKLVKGLLKDWAKNSIQNNARDKKLQLENLQEEMETKEVQQSHITMEQKIHKEYMQALAEEEITWRLKSRSLWLKAGDQNTSFFHRQAKARNWANQISEIKTPEGEIIKDFDQIKQQATNHFHKLYTTNGRAEDEIVDALLRHIPGKIIEEDNLHLNRQIEEDKILKASTNSTKTKLQDQTGSPYTSIKNVGT
jgi:hypothetical protein